MLRREDCRGTYGRVIDFNIFNRLTHMIDNAYIDDIKLLKNNSNLGYINEDIKSNLHQVGLLNQSISDIERQREFLARVGSSKDAQPKLEYKANKFCKILIEHGL